MNSLYYVTINLRFRVVTGRNEVMAKAMFLLVSVILLTWGVSASVHAGIPHPPPRADTPQSRHPSRADPPPRRRHPPPGSRLRHTVNERPVHILLECILVSSHCTLLPLNYFVPIAKTKILLDSYSIQSRDIQFIGNVSFALLHLPITRRELAIFVHEQEYLR